MNWCNRHIFWIADVSFFFRSHCHTFALIFLSSSKSCWSSPCRRKHCSRLLIDRCSTFRNIRWFDGRGNRRCIELHLWGLFLILSRRNLGQSKSDDDCYQTNLLPIIEKWPNDMSEKQLPSQPILWREKKWNSTKLAVFISFHVRDDSNLQQCPRVVGDVLE